MRSECQVQHNLQGMPLPVTYPRLGLPATFPLLRVNLFVGYSALAPGRMLLFYRRAISWIGDNMAAVPKSRLSKSKHTRFVLRPYRRIPTWLDLYYLSGECVGKGVVTNLSQSGMRVQGDHAVEPGLDLGLRLTLADDGPTIEIERATVRWVDGYESAGSIHGRCASRLTD